MLKSRSLDGLLEGSWVVISGIILPLLWGVTVAILLIAAMNLQVDSTTSRPHPHGAALKLQQVIPGNPTT